MKSQRTNKTTHSNSSAIKTQGNQGLKSAPAVSVLQQKTVGNEEELPAQMQFAAQNLTGTEGSVQQTKPFQLAAAIQAPKQNNTGLPDNLKAGIENLSGFAMDDVKVHYNSSKPAQLQAFAYAQGTDIHIGPGQERHLPHEAWHVAQQKQSRVKPTIQMKQGIAVNDDKVLETEADVMGAKALQMLEKPDNSPVVKNIDSGIQVVQGQWVSILSLSELERQPAFEKASQNPLAILSEILKARGKEEELKRIELLTSKRSEIIDEIQTSLRATLFSEGVFTDDNLLATVYNMLPQSEADFNESINDDDHPDVSDAPELLVDPFVDVNMYALGGKDPFLMFLIFKNWVISKGYPIGPNFETKYYQWLYGGVHTRLQFDRLFGPESDQGSGIMQSKAIQFARTPGTESNQASYNTKNFGLFNDVTYMRDGVGNIPFATTHNTPTKWQDPVKPGSLVDLNNDSTNKRYGIMSSGKKVEIAKASRAQHFAIGDRLLPNNGRGGTWTWHHLSTEYLMELVDMTVHAKHGHNGGVHLWK